jgi:hypothetical protein
MCRGLFLATKKPEREANHAPPPSAMLEMLYTYTAHISHGLVFFLSTGYVFFRTLFESESKS